VAWILAELPEPDGLGYRRAVDLAQDLERDGYTAAALVYYTHAAHVRPIAFAWSGVGRCQRDQGDLEAALKAFQIAIEAPGDDPSPALVGLVQILIDLGQPLDAADAVLKLLKTATDSPPALHTIARCLEHAARTELTNAASAQQLRDAATVLRDRARRLQPDWDAERSRKHHDRHGWDDARSYTVARRPTDSPDDVTAANDPEPKTSGEPAGASDAAFAPAAPAGSAWAGFVQWLRFILRRKH
jgi:tetratricopeptide (TPR) repeat protein